MNKLIKIVTISILALAISREGLAMSVADIGKVCLFSSMRGVINLNGEPVAHAKVMRTVDLSGAETDETSTDEKGNFKFPAIFKRTLSKHLPQEFSASQLIVVQYQGKEYPLWSAVKRKPEENSESRGKDLVVACELSSEEKMIKVNNSPIFSVCTWDVEPDNRPKAF